MILEEYGAAAYLCRNGVRKGINQLKFNLANYVKGNKKGFYKYTAAKEKGKAAGWGRETGDV